MLRKIIKAVTATTTIVTGVVKFCQKHPEVTHYIGEKVQDKIIDSNYNNKTVNYSYNSEDRNKNRK